MKNILITGAAGFIGSNITRSLLNDGHRVFGIDNFITGSRHNKIAHSNFHFTEGDIVNAETVRSSVPSTQLDLILHLACPTGVPNISKFAEEMMHTCSIGTFNILDIARQYNARLLYASSSEVYGEPLVTPQSEDYTGNVSSVGPRSPYEEGKRFAEAATMMYINKYNIHAQIVRFFNIYGTGMYQKDTRVLPRFLTAIGKNKPLEIYGDGTQRRTFLFISDLIKGLQYVLDKGMRSTIYNIGSAKEITIKDLATLALKVANSDQEIIFKPHFISDHSYRLPDLNKLKDLGWSENITLEHGIAKMLNEYNL